jgi:hypothetical protein
MPEGGSDRFVDHACHIHGGLIGANAQCHTISEAALRAFAKVWFRYVVEKVDGAKRSLS